MQSSTGQKGAHSTLLQHRWRVQCLLMLTRLWLQSRGLPMYKPKPPTKEDARDMQVKRIRTKTRRERKGKG